MRIIAIFAGVGLVGSMTSVYASPGSDLRPAMDNSPAVQAVDVSSAKPPLLFGWAHVGPGAPVVDATVHIVTRRGAQTDAPIVRTGLYGEFSVEVSDVELPRLVVVETRGGTVNGNPWRGRLRALIDMGPSRHMVHVNAATTIATAWQLARPGRSRAAADNRVRTVLGVEHYRNLESGMRLGTTSLDGTRIASAIERRGMGRWLRSNVRLMDARKPGPSFGPRAVVNPAGAGATAAGLLWSSVVAAAKGCNASDSSIPGLGYLASTLNKYGVVSQDPMCSGLPEILKDLAAIQQGITQIESELQQANDNIQAATNLIKVDTLSLALKQLQDDVLSPIQVGQSAYTNLTDAAQTTVSRLGMPLDEILASTDDSVVNDPNVQQLVASAGNMLEPAGVLGTNFAVAVNSLVQAGTISDGNANSGIFNLTWQAVRTTSAFIDAQQLAAYNTMIDYIRQMNSNAAALTIDTQRFTGLDSDQISPQIGDWKLPDAWFDTVSTELLGCPSATETLNGYCYPITVELGFSGSATFDYRAPVIDTDSGLIWGAVCAIEDMPVTNCDVSGLLTWADYGLIPPQWFQIPAYLWWSGGNPPGDWNRPTVEQVATLKAKAVANSQQPAAMNAWLARQSEVFAQVANAPIATSGVAWECGWGTDNRADLDYMGNFYYACDIQNWPCPEDMCTSLNRIGLQHTAFVVGTDVTGASSRIGWAVPWSPQNPNGIKVTNLPELPVPYTSPPTAFKGSVYKTDNYFVTKSVMEKIISAPPTQSETRMALTAAPLLAAPIDVTPYVVDNWFITQ